MKQHFLTGLIAAGLIAPVFSQVEERTPPSELFPIVKVVDGDTVHIRRQGEVQKLRLLSVDTEERMGDGFRGSRTKPNTIFGEKCALWAQGFFRDLAEAGEDPKIGLAFPNGLEAKDVYGRLLCNVILPDGTDFNVLLVREGKSPYFNKYGNSLIAHEAFVAAQAEAMAAKRGIWDPKTNEPQTPGAYAAKRPYDELIPWWQARADAVDAFRERARVEPEQCFASDVPEDLERAAQVEGPVEVFGQIQRIFDESNGDRTVLMRSGDKKRSLRVVLSRRLEKEHLTLDLEDLQAVFRQNYIYVRGQVTRGRRGFEMRSESAAAWRLAGPQVEPIETGEPVEAGSLSDG